jgi:hypothetical protein
VMLGDEYQADIPSLRPRPEVVPLHETVGFSCGFSKILCVHMLQGAVQVEIKHQKTILKTKKGRARFDTCALLRLPRCGSWGWS